MSATGPGDLADVPRLTFLGGAGTVTGSKFLLETSTAKVLIDCGLFQGLKQHRLRNWGPFPTAAADIDAVVITHSHVDHIGYLPALVRDGFRGAVHATRSTVDLAGIVLPDAGHLQEEEAAYANRKGFSKHKPAVPLYTEADARVALEHLIRHPFRHDDDVAPGVRVTLRPAGHILGSATVTVTLSETADRRIVFSGDLGRPHHPILSPPDPIGDADIVVMESTYGDRDHDDPDAIGRFADAIARTAARGGTVLIPAFAVDRTEVVLYHLRTLLTAGAVPDLPVFVDSPMALAALGVYRSAIRRGDVDVNAAIRTTRDPFDAGNVTEIHDVEGSKALAERRGPAIIISASGMATGGRVVHHLRRLLPDHRNTVLLVGYQAPGTRGRLLADGASQIKMLGHDVRSRADIVDLGAFSVHADRSELLRWLGTATRPPDTVYLVHGDETALRSLRDRIGLVGRDEAVVARDGQVVRLA